MDDYALALQLQAELDEQSPSQSATNTPDLWIEPAKHTSGDDTASWSLVDPRWEMIDPIPDVRAMFMEFNNKYFWRKLDGIEVRWSPRMTLCAGLCVYEGRGGLCSVRLSQPLLKLRPRKDLVETLLHEMIHAYLFITDNNRDHDAHGPEFHKHMYRINNATGTNITVYHTFHDEVDNYRQHWWLCDGPCQKRPPYFGHVKRAMNRAPSPRDPWWADHQRTCGGTYRKIKEPEGYGQKTKKGGKEDRKGTDKPKGNADIRLYGSKGRDDHTSSAATDNTPKSSSNIHGIAGPVDQSVNEPRASSQTSAVSKIHGFSETAGSDSSDTDGMVVRNLSDRSSQQENAAEFPGQGVRLTSAASSQHTGKIVRRIPGLGLITSERPLLGSTSKESLPASQPSENMAVTPSTSSATVIRPEDTNECVQLSDVQVTDTTDGGADGRAGISRPHSLPDLRLDAADEQVPSHNAQHQPRGRQVLHSNKKKAFRDDSPIGTIKRIKGFMSVGNVKKSPKDFSVRPRKPVRLGNPSGKSKGQSSAAADGERAGVKRKSSGDLESFAMDRNKRACHISSSESESESEENVPLKTAVRKTSGSQLRTSASTSSLPDSLAMSREKETNDLFCKPFPANYGNDKDKDSLSGPSVPAHHHNQPSLGATVNPRGMENTSSANSQTAQGSGTSGVQADPLRNCPVCQIEVRDSEINNHLDLCLAGGC